MIVAIDGPAGSGKSTIAREVAERYGFEKLDTGALYRTCAAVCADEGVELDDEAAVVDRSREIDIRFDAHGEATRISADGRDVSDEIRTPRIDRIVSQVSAYPGVREAMLPVQRRFAEGRDVVAEGRDIGTVVFPEADLKVFLTADPRARARRRVPLADLERRDALDSSRAVAPLVAAEDAVHIDSTAHTIDQIVERVGELIRERR